MPLEPICQQLHEVIPKIKKGDGYYPGPRGSFNDSWNCGCRYCYAACQAVSDGNNIEVNNSRNQEAVKTNSRLDFCQLNQTEAKKDMKITATLNGSSLVFSGGSASKELFVEEGVHDPIIPTASSISGNTGSEQSLHTAMKWRNTCMEEHTELCPRPTLQTLPRLPSRIINIGNDKSPGVRLVETQGEQALYACLSHCWGGQQPLVTTRNPDTLSLYKQEVPWNSLPKTFQEAILFARKFDLTYLWIDSLCIVQDDTDDWMVQSALMADIYQNAIITLAGSASAGPHQGLFRIADPIHIDQPFPMSTDLEGMNKIRCRASLSHDHAALPLLQRCWVFQERLLSPRYLHFGQNELIWECMEKLICECGNLNITEPGLHNWLEPKNRLHPHTLYRVHTIPNRVSVAWQAAIADYARMDITDPSDIFPAISGVVKGVSKATGWEYAAGLWKETFLVDLMWRIQNPHNASRLEKWRAPTFSWASVINTNDGKRKDRGYVTYGLVRDWIENGLNRSDGGWATEFCATIVKTSCKPVGHDMTGQLKSAFVVLQGTLIEARLCRIGSGWGGTWELESIEKKSLDGIRVFPDINLDRAGLEHESTVYCMKLIETTQAKTAEMHHARTSQFYVMLRKVGEIRMSTAITYDSFTFERIAVFFDGRGFWEKRIEDLSPDRALQRDAMVKIV